jgi:hypothetical protein
MPPAPGGPGTDDSTGTQSWTPDFDDTDTGAGGEGGCRQGGEGKDGNGTGDDGKGGGR